MHPARKPPPPEIRKPVRWVKCWECDGSGEDTQGNTCEDCDGLGKVKKP